MAVYYATTQQRTLGRLLTAKDVRLWVRGGNHESSAGRLVPSLEDLITKLRLRLRRRDQENRARLDPAPQQASAPGFHLAFSGQQFSIFDNPIRFIMGLRTDFRTSDPDEYSPDLAEMRSSDDLKSGIIYHCFTPSVASVITISDPQCSCLVPL